MRNLNSQPDEMKSTDISPVLDYSMMKKEDDKAKLIRDLVLPLNSGIQTRQLSAEKDSPSSRVQQCFDLQ